MIHFQTYKKYNGYNWYSNAGQYPVEKIINKYPNLVHSMHREFGVSWDRMCEILYLENINDCIEDLKNWCFDKNRIPSILHFDEKNVMTLETTFGQMARLILYNITTI
jgi:hypothetical protein